MLLARTQFLQQHIQFIVEEVTPIRLKPVAVDDGQIRRAHCEEIIEAGKVFATSRCQWTLPLAAVHGDGSESGQRDALQVESLRVRQIERLQIAMGEAVQGLAAVRRHAHVQLEVSQARQVLQDRVQQILRQSAQADVFGKLQDLELSQPTQVEDRARGPVKRHA